MRRLWILAGLTIFGLTTIVERGLAQGWIMPKCRPDVPCIVRGPGVVRTNTAIRVTLDQRVAHYEITETFKNTGGGLGEAEYLFPMPPGAAFQDLRLTIDGELVSGETLDAAEARNVYETIVRRQRDPALVEWMGSGLLRARIFPINAGDEKQIVVRYQAVVPREGDALRLDYHGGRQWTYDLRYAKSEGYGPPYSPTHELTVDTDENMRTVHISGVERDLTLLLPVAHHNAAAMTMLPYAPGNRDGFALITITPPALHVAPTPRDMTLVIDVSGSMSGRKIEQARAAGRAVLSTLTPQDRFRLIDFSTDVRTFQDHYVFASPENVRQAQRYLDALEASGSTNLEGALLAALGNGEEDIDSSDHTDPTDRMRLILFVTDGEPTIGERTPSTIVAHAVDHLHHARLFTFGLGTDVNAPLLEQLALQGHGTSQFVRPEESVERAVSLVAHQLADPVITDLTLTADGVRLGSSLPSGPVDLFAGQDLILLTRYHGSGAATLHFTGHTSNGPIAWAASANFPERDRTNPFVARLWATQRIGYLSAERHRNGASAEVNDEIKALGQEFGIPTELTSYLVQEPGAQVATNMPMAAMSMDAMAPQRRAASFEQAKTASAQRGAVSLSAADGAVGSTASAPMAAEHISQHELQHVGDRTLQYRDSLWIDTRYHDGMRIVHVVAYSPAYFALLEAFPDLRKPLAVGEHVRVAGRNVAIETGDRGISVEKDLPLTDLRENW